MKKLLVVLLAVVMVLAFATSAFAYTDTNSLSVREQDAIYELSALGILKGDGDGTFAPERTISRAEFAKIACYLGGFGPSADNYVGTAVRYKDVPNTHWAAGYIAAADSYGYVKGYPDGTYKPNQTINMQEAVTILLRVAGYNDNLPGPWPFDYIAQAAKIGVTAKVNFTGTAPARRAAVAVMSSNLLECTQVYWSAVKSTFVAIDANTIGDVYYWWTEDPLVANNFDTDRTIFHTQVGDWYIMDYSKKTVAIEPDMFMRQDMPTFLGRALAPDCYISGGKTFYEIQGQIANIFFDKDPSDPTAKIIYIGLKSELSYSKDVDVVDAARGVIRIDGEEITLSPGFDSDMFQFMAANDNRCKVWKDDKGYVYRFELLDNELDIAVFDSYNATTGYAYWWIGGMINNTFAFYTADKDFVLLKDGKVCGITDLVKGDVVSFDTNYITDDFLSATTTKVHGVHVVCSLPVVKTGTLEKGTATELFIDGAPYSWSRHQETRLSTTDFKTWTEMTSAFDLTNAYGKSVKYILINPYHVGYVASAAAAATTETVYGIVKSATENSAGQLISLTIFGTDGKDTTYTVDPTKVPIWWNNDTDNGAFIEATVRISDKAITAVQTFDPGMFPGIVRMFVWADKVAATDGCEFMSTGWSNYIADAREVYDGDWDEAPLNVTPSAGRLVHVPHDPPFNNSYDIIDTTVIFNVTTTDYEYADDTVSMSKAAIIPTAEFLAARGVTCDAYLAKYDKNGDLIVLMLLNGELDGAYKYGIITAVEATGIVDKWNVTIGGVTYTYARQMTDADPSTLKNKAFVQYEVTGTTITSLKVVLNTTNMSAITGNVCDTNGLFVQPFGNTDTNCAAAWAVPATNTLGFFGYNYQLTDKTLFYRVAANGTITPSVNTLGSAGGYVSAITTSDTPYTVLRFVFIYDTLPY